MTYEVRYSPSALRDLERIRADVLHVSGNSNTAFRYISELLDKDRYIMRTVSPATIMSHIRPISHSTGSKMKQYS